ncbi:DNA methyltransferase [Corynebacterium amycolatum]|uniref:DNA methyltransferase n=1 Tax=Corynebacterium amycolatum TaxID=43765 RepID=UPI002883390E|nr:DNA methyltransferase [Corynebacterium amycolatum]
MQLDTVYDPAAGSGNFLTETYICLRRLENVVLTHLQGGQSMMGLDDVNASPIKVSLRQFHGIEINDFAVSVAQTAMWIAELQANQETAMIVARMIDDLPLRDSAHIIQASALDIDWNCVVPAKQCSYVISNPPFITGDDLSVKQKKERSALFGKHAGILDYVACWFILAARYARDTDCECAFVATSSICQGQQVPALWQPMFKAGVRINFAHRGFSWDNEAGVHVVIVGFAHKIRDERYIFYPELEGTGDHKQQVSNINPYLLDAPDAFVERKRSARKDMPRMSKGFQPTDNGNLLVDKATYDAEVALDPGIAKYIRRFTQARQYIEGETAYIIWVSDDDLPDIAAHPFLNRRIKANKEYRSHDNRPKAGDAYKLKDKPHRPRPAGAFVDNKDYLLIPRHTSHRRRYIPIGFVEKAKTIPGDATSFIPTDDKVVFGLLVSRLMTLWLDMTGGRLRADYRFGSDTVYNTLPVLNFTVEDRARITECAEKILAERQKLIDRGKSLEMMYKPGDELYYPRLFDAHDQLDKAVYKAYGLPIDINEKDVQVFLFNEYLKSNKTKTSVKK